jgi:hypothetical protein
MKIANLFEDSNILKLAQRAAKELLDDGLDKYPLLRERCDALLTDEIIMN